MPEIFGTVPHHSKTLGKRVERIRSLKVGYTFKIFTRFPIGHFRTPNYCRHNRSASLHGGVEFSAWSNFVGRPAKNIDRHSYLVLPIWFCIDNHKKFC